MLKARIDEQSSSLIQPVINRHGPFLACVFDLLYHAGRCRMREPLVRRRELLIEVCQKLKVPEVKFSPAVIAAGTAFYQEVVTAGHEGVMAKLQNSPYRPGKRAGTWKKIKPRAR